MTIAPHIAATFKRVNEAAAARGERVTGAYGSPDGQHWKFTYEKVGRKREVAPPVKHSRGVRQALDKAPPAARKEPRQSSLF